MLLYQRIRNHIQALLAAGSMTPGAKLPSERALQETFSSTRITVREALARLEAEGLIFSQKRRGWFVTPEKLKWHPAKKVNFNHLAIEQGFTPTTQVVAINAPSTEPEFSHSHFNGQPVYELTRVRALDGRAMMMEQIYCAAERFADLHNQPLDGSITEVMSTHYQVDVSFEHCVISVTVLPDDVADKLEKNNGAPCLKVLRARYDAEQALVDYNIEYWLHDAIEMIVEGV
ncbi:MULTISPECIES: UTRA domain-containing protein [Pseudoalteromonas]|uniref:UTRA domain-containing protein n=1 Tax=Pseudoalteromonas TaxID=53246 RepID=UPI000FFF4593|nr:UTRA domain-containing protein [Pseudoalteromonas sp. A757]RXE84578.1 phosphonate ABC transporter [Pseudoalteromonas sp. A757]